MLSSVNLILSLLLGQRPSLNSLENLHLNLSFTIEFCQSFANSKDRIHVDFKMLFCNVEMQVFILSLIHHMFAVGCDSHDQ